MHIFDEATKNERRALYQTLVDARMTAEEDPTPENLAEVRAARVRLNTFDEANGYL